MITSLRPSHFKDSHPWSSIEDCSDAEVVARNIMKISARLGDVWGLSWAQYKSERVKSGDPISYLEHEIFKRVLPKVNTPEKACAFSSTWADAGKGVLSQKSTQGDIGLSKMKAVGHQDAEENSRMKRGASLKA